MDIIDLVEVRRRLHDYKKLGKESTFSILKQLQMSSDLTPDLLEQSKIYKTLASLSKMDIPKEVDSQFSEQNLTYIRDMSKSLVRQIKEILNTNDGRKNSTFSNNSDEKVNPQDKQQPSKPIKPLESHKELPHKEAPQKETKIHEEKEQLITKTQPLTNDPVQDLVQDLSLPKDFPEQRRKVIIRLISVMMSEKTTQALINQYTGSRYAQLCKKLEDEAFVRYPEKTYRDIVKQMIKHFMHDQDFSVSQRFLRGIIEPKQAVLMKTEDWMGDQKLIESRQQATEAIKAGDIQHFKRIAQEINKDVVLGKCSNCDELKLKLVDEKQTRAADEPSTKFYECLSCGWAETTN